MSGASTPDHKALIIILDGLGDRPVAALAGKTPLQAAATPVLDALVTGGQCGLVDPLFPGVAVDTHTGAGALMGLSPKFLQKLPRGPVEALGVGLEMRPGDIALRCNFATVEVAGGSGNTIRIVDRRAQRIREGTADLCSALTDVAVGNGVFATVRPATQHRGVLRLRGPDLSPHITDTDPGDGTPAHVLQSRAWDDDDASKVTAAAVNTFVRRAVELLDNHPVNQQRRAAGMLPANGILTRGAGEMMRVRSLVRHLALRAAVVCGEKTIQGLGHLLGYDVITDARFTSLPDTDLAAKVAAARAALQDHDLVVLHIKAPDVCSHDRDPAGKVAATERIDAALRPLLSDDLKDLIVAVSCDHSTDSSTGQHCGDPVPTILRAPRGRIDGCRTYDEITCAGGGLGRLTGAAFFSVVIDAMGGRGTYRPNSADFLA